MVRRLALVGVTAVAVGVSAFAVDVALSPHGSNATGMVRARLLAALSGSSSDVFEMQWQMGTAQPVVYWCNGDQTRCRVDNGQGQQVQFVVNATGTTVTTVSYINHTWSERHYGSARPMGILASSYLPSALRADVNTGNLQVVDQNADVAGQSAIELTVASGSNPTGFRLWVNAESYLPIRTTAMFGSAAHPEPVQTTFSFLVQSTESLKNLEISIPGSFARVQSGASAGSTGISATGGSGSGSSGAGASGSAVTGS